MSEKQSRKRGANFTEEEKSLLLHLIAQYQDIVENKRTDGIMVRKKKEVWDAITQKYNRNCSSGLRDTNQLKVLYDNLKQKSRKQTQKKAPCFMGKAKILIVEDVTQDSTNTEEDYIDMKKTSNDFWKPKETDKTILPTRIVQEATEPLYNPFDSDSGFLKNDFSHGNPADLLEIKISPTYEMEERNDEEENEDSSENDDERLVETPTTDRTQRSKNLQPAMSTVNNAARNKLLPKKKVNQPRNINKCSAEAFKRLYFQKKCQNADLERKKLLTEIMNLKKEHEIKMQILRKQLNE